jgi:hypothetical protein
MGAMKCHAQQHTYTFAAFGFQMNERYLIWDDSAARQLIRMTLSEKLNISMEEVDQRLEELGVLVPGGGGVCSPMEWQLAGLMELTTQQ